MVSSQVSPQLRLNLPGGGMSGLAILVLVIIVLAVVVFVIRRAMRLVYFLVGLALFFGILFLLSALASRRDRLPFGSSGLVGAFLDALEDPVLFVVEFFESVLSLFSGILGAV